MEEKEKIKGLFKNSDPKICSICGKPSQHGFYGACCDEHRKKNCEIFMEQVKSACKKMPKAKLHFERGGGE